MRKHCLWLVLIWSCASPFDSPEPGDAVESAAPDQVAPDPGAGAWSAPRPLVALDTSADERFAAPSADGLTLMFARTERSGSFYVNRPYVARRTALDAPFDPPARAAAFGDTSIWDFEVSADGLEWYYWKGLGQLARSRRSSLDEPWSPPEELGFEGLSPSLSTDGLRLYYLRAGSPAVILRERSSRAAPWGQPRAVLVAGERAPIAIDISKDELQLLITADTRLPDGGVFIASRADPDADFEEPVPVATLQGAFEAARFGAGDRLIAVTDARRNDRALAIAERR